MFIWNNDSVTQTVQVVLHCRRHVRFLVRAQASQKVQMLCIATAVCQGVITYVNGRRVIR
jgi:hypothetical protein